MPKIATPHFVMPRAALELYRFAGSDDSRGNLKYIHFESEKEAGKGKISRFHAVTTDGHRLMHVSWYGSGQDSLPCPVHVEAEAAAFLLQNIKKEKISDPPVKITLSVQNGDVMLMSSTEVGTKDGPYEERMDVGYPDWQQVVPRPQSEPMSVSQEVGMDLKYLVDFNKFIWVCGYDTTGVVMHYHDEQSMGPVLWTPMGTPKDPDVNFEYVLMPMRF